MSNLWDDLKDTFLKAKDSSGKIAKIALDKTTNAVNITKLNLAKGEADGKINKLYSKIGESIYSQYKAGTEFEGDIAEFLIEIDKFKAESDELKEQIAALKRTSPCSVCGQQNDKTSEYCTKCGAKLTTEADDEVEADTAEADDEDQVIDITPNEEQ